MLIHSFGAETIFKIPSQIFDDAWLVIGTQSQTHFMDGTIFKKHLTSDYGLLSHLRDVVYDAVERRYSVEETLWYKQLTTKTTDEQQADVQRLVDVLAQLHIYDNQQLQESKVVYVCDDKQIHAIEQTLSWRITKPLRLVRKVQLSLRTSGTKATIQKIWRRLIHK